MSGLKALVASELALPAPDAAVALADAICARHGDAVAAVIFYGSCLRKRTAEGVLDFYVLVDGYRAASESWWKAALNAALPPNVYYLEAETPDGTVRCKYAVISSADFAHCVSAACNHPYIWSRFAQPALLAYARDEAARDHVVDCAARAVTTLVERLAVFLPAHGRVQRYSYAALWQDALTRTYSSEFRSEQPETIRSLYQSNVERYDTVAGLALDDLVERGWLDSVRHRGPAVEVEMPPGRRRRARWRWSLLRPLAKATMLVRLLKTAFTFGDWLPYALWKVERHSGVRIEPTERQRAHPLIFGWPVIARVLFSRTLR